MKHERVNEADRHPHPAAHALWITGIYLTLGTLWILFSDFLVNSIATDPAHAARLQSLKGVVFVAVTALVIYLLLHRSFHRLHETNRQLDESREEHRTSADYLRALFEAAPLALYDLDTRGRVKRLWNPAAEALFGWTREEALGHPPRFIPEDRKTEFEGLFAEVLRGRTVVGTELSRVCKDGSEIYIELFAVPLYDRHGEVTAVISIAGDITEKRRRAQELRSALDEKDALLREVHHRVKNNLAVMTGLVRLQLHESSAEDGSAGALSKTRDRMEVMSLIHNMLYHEQNLSQIEFSGVLKRVVSQLLEQYSAIRSVRLDLDLQDSPLEIGTALPLGLIANEAVTNALTHAFPAEAGENRLTVRLRVRGESRSGGSAAGAPAGAGNVGAGTDGAEECVLTVEDNGVGIGEGFDVRQQDSLGFRMMFVLAQQVQAELTVTAGADGAGTRVEVTLPR